MPYSVKKENGKYCIYKKDTGKKVGCTDGTKEALKKYMGALHMHEDTNNNLDKYKSILKSAENNLRLHPNNKELSSQIKYYSNCKPPYDNDFINTMESDLYDNMITESKDSEGFDSDWIGTHKNPKSTEEFIKTTLKIAKARYSKTLSVLKKIPISMWKRWFADFKNWNKNSFNGEDIDEYMHIHLNGKYSNPFTDLYERKISLKALLMEAPPGKEDEKAAMADEVPNPDAPESDSPASADSKKDSPETEEKPETSDVKPAKIKFNGGRVRRYNKIPFTSNDGYISKATEDGVYVVVDNNKTIFVNHEDIIEESMKLKKIVESSYFKPKAMMVIFSHLSDISESGTKTQRIHAEFVKYILSKVKDLNTAIDPDKMYSQFKKDRHIDDTPDRWDGYKEKEFVGGSRIPGDSNKY